MDAALSENGTTTEDVCHFLPGTWPQAVGEALLGGLHEAIAIGHRSHPLARAARHVHDRPLLGTALAVGELATGVVLTSVLRGGWKTIGVTLVVDATADLGIIWARTRRGQAR